MTFVLQVVTEVPFRQPEPVYPRFANDTRFNSSWWRNSSATSPVSYCRFLHDDEEVGRAKILTESGVYAGYTTWRCPPGGTTEIDLIEIRADLRRSNKRFGRHLVEAICRTYDQPAVAMSLDDTSDGFWRSIGWTAHTHPDGGRYRTLFTSA